MRSSSSSTPPRGPGRRPRPGDGTVSEFRAGGDPDNLTITQVTSSNAHVAILSSGNPLPAPTVLGPAGRTPPTEVIDDDNAGNVETGGTFDPADDAIDFYESLEGMLLQVNDGSVVNATRSFGEITLLPDHGAWATGLRSPRGGILLGGYTDPNPERITVDDEILRDLAPLPRPAKAMPDMNVGDQLTSAVVGPLDYSFSNYKIQALTTPTFTSAGIPREVTGVAKLKEVSVATFNVENLAGTDPQAKFDHLASLIVYEPRCPGGRRHRGGPGQRRRRRRHRKHGRRREHVTLDALIAAIQAAGGPTYQYRQIDPVDDQDGGAPGGNIRVGFLFRTDPGADVRRPAGRLAHDETRLSAPSPTAASSRRARAGRHADATSFARRGSRSCGEFRIRNGPAAS